MTHAEAIRGNKSGLEPTSCGGELVSLRSYPDACYEGGRIRPRTVEVLHCQSCGRRISIDKEAGLALNDYQDPGSLVRELARVFDAKPGLPVPGEDCI